MASTVQKFLFPSKTLHWHPRNGFWRNFWNDNYFELKSTQHAVFRTGCRSQFAGEHGLRIVGIVIWIHATEAWRRVAHSHWLGSTKATKDAGTALLQTVCQPTQTTGILAITTFEVQITRRISLVCNKKLKSNQVENLYGKNKGQ